MSFDENEIRRLAIDHCRKTYDCKVLSDESILLFDRAIAFIAGYKAGYKEAKVEASEKNVNGG